MSALRTACARFRVTTIVILLLQIAFLILFGFHVRYSPLAMPNTIPESEATYRKAENYSSTNETLRKEAENYSSTDETLRKEAENYSSTDETLPSTRSPVVPAEITNAHVTDYYAMFEDIHVMMFIGFGFLMTFLKKYGFSSVGFNFLLGAIVLQWATLTGGYILHWHEQEKSIFVDMTTLINADFAAATILISFGAVLGKLSALQLVIMTFIEVVAFQANELFVFKFLKATDVGDSMVVHTFGAYFGLMVAWINYRKETREAEDKEGSVYQSDIFAMIGTIFLWLFWPSFNSATAVDEGRLRAIINTYYSLTASCIAAFAFSALVSKDKFNMVHIQNSTLAGGVAVGTLADMIIQPWGAILVGFVGGTVSVFGYRYLTPFLSKHLKLHDTCGVNNLHGMPGIISGLGSILAAGLATKELYGDGLEKIFGSGRTPREQAGYQAAALGVSFGMAIVCGAITGIVLRIPIWNFPTADEIFDDDQSWILPMDEDDDKMEGKTGQYRPSDNRGYEDSMEMNGTSTEAHKRHI